MAKGRTTRPRNSSNDSVSSATDGKQALTVKSPEKTKRAGRRAKTALSKKRASKVDALKPKKPPTAFFYFLLGRHAETSGKQGLTMRRCSTMTSLQKSERSLIAMADFVKKKDSGEFDAYEDDSGFAE